MSEKQLSRVAGCPRLPLAVFKAAAEQYFVGKDATRTEQQNGKKSKVKLLRELSTNDPAVRSWLIKFAKEYKAEQTRRLAAAQGLTINADGRAVSDIDRMVALLEAGEKLEDHFTSEDLNGPGDPDWPAKVAEIEALTTPKPPIVGCDRCGFNNGPATRVIGKAHYCDQHDGQPTGPVLATVSNPADPAAYINSDWGKSSTTPVFPDPGGRVAALHALRDALANAPRARGGADYGPTQPLK